MSQLSEQFREAMKARGRDPDTGELTPAEAARRAPASGLSDERLAELLHFARRNCARLTLDEIESALAEIARNRSDAVLGAALRDALATLAPGFSIEITPDRMEQFAAYVLSPFGKERTDATRALAALLSRVPDERTRT